MSDFQRAETGDIFDDGNGNFVKVFRRSRTGTWVDIVVVTRDYSTWSKRMPLGIPATWLRMPRR